MSERLNGRRRPSTAFVDVEGCRAALNEMRLDDKEKRRSEQDRDGGVTGCRITTLDGWLYLWLLSWAGTIIAGAGFGGLVGGLFGWFVGLIVGAIVGAIYAAVVGLLAVSTVVCIGWMLWLDRHPVLIACCAAGLTAILCAPWVFPLTLTAGVLGGLWAGNRFMSSCSYDHWCSIDIERDGKPSSFTSFTLSDLFARMTATAILLSIWLVVIRFVWWRFVDPSYP